MNAVSPITRAASADLWGDFLRPLLLAVSNPPSQGDFRVRLPVIAAALSHIPGDMLTPWRQRDLLRAFKFFPSVAELDEWFAPALRDRKATTDLKALPAPKPEVRGPRTIEEITAVRASVQAFMAERNAAGTVNEMPPVEPRYLSEGHLIAVLERQAKEPGVFGNLAKLRLAGLRAKQGVPA